MQKAVELLDATNDFSDAYIARLPSLREGRVPQPGFGNLWLLEKPGFSMNRPLRLRRPPSR
jgi:hypothetical protein